MYCLACGDCCKRMSPLSSANVPCPKLVMEGDIAVCSDYEHRPEECVRHDFPARICPIGMSVLGIDIEDKDKLQNRIAQVDIAYHPEAFKG